jgi:para-aminobenzoate synthetase / 4-amino-4-deoxychorismate lyase
VRGRAPIGGPRGARVNVFALLDDADATPARPCSRLYSGWLREHRCDDPQQLDAACAAVNADLAAGAHAVLLADYEWGTRLLRAGDATLDPADAGVLRVLIFERVAWLSADEVSQWLAQQDGGCSEHSAAGALDLHSSVDRAGFDAAIGTIHEAIRRGETYQVNYTYRITGSAFGSPVALYRRLRAHQRVGFGALIRLPAGQGNDVQWVLSRSPELFVRHEAGIVQARPMKGTAVRARAPESDSETARLLHQDVKNRAENLMIVDLLRNDLGRVAELGSVQVPQLFEIEPYATVFQMTSTVRACLRADVGLAGLLRASFPCGSITGAPKHQTMKLIADLETTPRGLYTGAIGWIQRPAAGAKQACPDLCLSVAIRTITLGAPTPQGLRPLQLGVGGGIVLDSVAADEFEETRWKARFLTALDPGLELFETMRVEGDGRIVLLERHRARIAASAAAFGFDFDDDAFDAALARALPACVADHPSRLRLALRAGGMFSHRCVPLAPLPRGPVMLRIEPQPLQRMPLAGHKTSDRAAYDAGIRAAEAAGAFDSLFFGEAGELIEGGRSTVLLRIAGRWCTPPVEDGALPGVMRAALLDDPAWAPQVCRLTRADLARASEIVVCNALRGVLAARLLPLSALQSERAELAP